MRFNLADHPTYTCDQKPDEIENKRFLAGMVLAILSTDLID
jgi:hypothetical protein